MKAEEKRLAESVQRLKEQYIQAHLVNNTVLKKLLENILKRINEKPPKL